MNKALIQELIKLPFQCIDLITETFPSPIKESLEQRKYELLDTVGEAIQQIMTENKATGTAEEKPKVNSISID